MNNNNSGIMYPLAFTLVVGLIGAFVNQHAIPYLPHVHLILGNAAYIVIAMRLKAPFALLATLISVTPLMFLWGHPWGYLTFGLEAFFVAKLREKGWYVLFADVVYWLIIGIPLTAFIIWATLPNPFSYLVFASVKQGFNGLLYTSLGCLIIFFSKDKLHFGQYQQPAVVRGLRSQLLYSIILVTACSVIVASQFGSRSIVENEQQLVSKSLKDSARSIVDVAGVFISQHEKVIGLTATLLSQQSNQTNNQKILQQMHQQFDSFKTMLIADSHGDITAASPRMLVEKLKYMDNTNVSDRHYFQHAIKQNDVYLSPVFRGRGFGHEILVAISAPIYQSEDKQKVTGIVQGTISANIAEQLSLAKFGEENINVVIVDQFNNIIFASKALKLKPLSQFNFEEINNGTQQNSIAIASLQKKYLVEQHDLIHQWKVYALMDESIIISNIEKQFVVIFFILSLTLIISTLVAYSFSQRLTLPLNFILQQIKQYDLQKGKELAPLYMTSTREINQIYDELISDKATVNEYQNELEHKVTERTEALNAANKQLQKLALKDGLTNVYNRYYLDQNFSVLLKTAQRNNVLLALVMLDIDHFKLLNDRYGHLTGDQCLIKLARLISQQFARETDTIVRFGGEEFLLLLPNVTVEKLTSMLEELRQVVEKHIFYGEGQEIFSFTISMGAMIAPANYSNEIRDWIKVADEALYEAKHGGRNTVIIKNKLP